MDSIQKQINNVYWRQERINNAMNEEKSHIDKNIQINRDILCLIEQIKDLEEEKILNEKMAIYYRNLASILSTKPK